MKPATPDSEAPDLLSSLALERYKFVTDRQRYYTELARHACASYARFLAALTVGTVALIASTGLLHLPSPLVRRLVDLVGYLLTFLGCVAIVQMLVSLVRWRGYRHAETKISPDTPPAGRWWWLPETLYATAVAVSVLCIWLARTWLPELIGPL